MKTNRIFTVLLLLLVASGPLWIWMLQSKVNNHMDLSIMSFNIRHGKADDGENNWEFRKDLVADVIRDANLDIVGLQEVYRFQLDELLQRLPEYDMIGTGRDGGEEGEYSCILFRKNRFKVIESETFWLSDTPDVPSTSWGNYNRRICTWANLFDQHSGKSFAIYNTHLDHQSQASRTKSVRSIIEKITTRSSHLPLFLCGDLNADEDNKIITYLKGAELLDEMNPIPLLDTWRHIHPDNADCGTICRFNGNREPIKIDYIFTTPGIKVMNAGIVRTNREGRYPSDHYPVVALVRISE